MLQELAQFCLEKKSYFLRKPFLKNVAVSPDEETIQFVSSSESVYAFHVSVYGNQLFIRQLNFETPKKIRIEAVRVAEEFMKRQGYGVLFYAVNKKKGWFEENVFLDMGLTPLTEEEEGMLSSSAFHGSFSADRNPFRFMLEEKEGEAQRFFALLQLGKQVWEQVVPETPGLLVRYNLSDLKEGAIYESTFYYKGTEDRFHYLFDGTTCRFCFSASQADIVFSGKEEGVQKLQEYFKKIQEKTRLQQLFNPPVKQLERWFYGEFFGYPENTEKAIEKLVSSLKGKVDFVLLEEALIAKENNRSMLKYIWKEEYVLFFFLPVLDQYLIVQTNQPVQFFLKEQFEEAKKVYIQAHLSISKSYLLSTVTVFE